MCDRTVQFNVLCKMLEAVSKSKKSAVKRKHLATFLDHVYTDHEFYSALRLILPGLDTERAAYSLKEAALARCLSDALGLARNSTDAKRLLDWKQGSHGGDFPLIAADILSKRQSTSSGNLTIKDVNDSLDKLAASETREKTGIIADFIKKTNVQQMTWIIRVILKDMKLGISEKTVFQEFHPDAENLFNVSCDLKLVCEKLKDRSQRLMKKDIVVGIPVRPQLASRATSVEEAWNKLKGKGIVVECKFDGDRIQIHKNGNEVHFFSRSFINHKEYTEALTGIVCQQIQIERCILDGEMLVWNKLTNRFADFGANQGAAKAAKEGLETDQQLCYVAFDILYAGDSSVTDQSLSERQCLLKQVVQPLKGSLELLLPGFGPDQLPWSLIVYNLEEINKFFSETVENREEGIVLKDLGSKWEPGERSTKWIKLKPDYIHAESDLDALIIGCYIGTGRRGGEVSQFLLGIAEKPKAGGYPTRFLSFCRIGSGLSDSDRDVLVSKLKPYLRRYEKNTKPPSFYILTNIGKERPDFWVEQPDKSIILEITSDIRTFKSEFFASPYSLRFPRIHRVRYDKPWYDCLDVDTLVQIVHARDGVRAAVKEPNKQSKSRAPKFKRGGKPLLPVVPSHFLVTDVSQVKQETIIFKGLVFHFINFQSQFTRDQLHKLVAQNGGRFAMNLGASVTHVIAAEKKGMKYTAAAMTRDIVHQSWVLDCCAHKTLLPLTPKYMLHLSQSSKIKSKDDTDAFGDNYFQDVEVLDLKQLFRNMDRMKYAVSKAEICQFQTKHLKREGFGEFCNSCLFFHNPIHINNIEIQMVAKVELKRLALEVLMLEGEVVCQLSDATHMVVYSLGEHSVPFKKIVETMAFKDWNAFMSDKLHLVKHTWLVDALVSKERPIEERYNLKESVTLPNNEEDFVTPDKCQPLSISAGGLVKRDISGMFAQDLDHRYNEFTSRRWLSFDKIGDDTCSTLHSMEESKARSPEKKRYYTDGFQTIRRNDAAESKILGQERERGMIYGKKRKNENIEGSEKIVMPLKEPDKDFHTNVTLLTDDVKHSQSKRSRDDSGQGKERTNIPMFTDDVEMAGLHLEKLDENQDRPKPIVQCGNINAVSPFMSGDHAVKNPTPASVDRLEGDTPGPKKKVSYRDLVHKLLGP